MVDPGFDFGLVVDTAIAHTKTCVATAAVEKENATAGLLILQEDLRKRGVPPQLLAKIGTYVQSLSTLEQPKAAA